jgi:hypothetical protein
MPQTAAFTTARSATQTGGVPYATTVAVPTTNADNDLGNAPGNLASPVATVFAQVLAAEVQIILGGTIGANAGSFVVLQTDMGDGNWYDVAWCQTTTTTPGTLNFYFQVGLQNVNAVIQQSRVVGAAPASNGTNAIALGGRFRFVGRNQLSGGAAPTMTVNIKYWPFGIR